MFEKQGKFYADWRDRTGKRKRKAFTSERAAIRYEDEQKALAHPKKRREGRHWLGSSPQSTAISHPAIVTPGQAAPSSLKLVPSRRANSQPPTSRKSTIKSAPASTPTPAKRTTQTASEKNSAGSGKRTAQKSSTTKSSVTPAQGRATSQSPTKKSTASSRLLHRS